MNRPHKSQIKKGFTIVEVSLSMAFISVLLITIAAITINILSIYQKGLSVRAVNATGRELVDEFSRAIANSPAKTILNQCNNYTGVARARCTADHGQKLIFQEVHHTGSITINDGANLTGSATVTNPPIHGVFCTGRYSYIWNTGYVLNDSYGLSSSKATIRYNGADQPKYNNFRLIRITDQDRAACKNHIDSDTYTYKSSNKYDLGNGVSDPVRLLDSAEDNLALYDFQIFPPTQHDYTRHTYFSGTFILATATGNVNITATGDYCNSIPDNLSTDFAYCAINKFNFAARATGGLNVDEKIQN